MRIKMLAGAPAARPTSPVLSCLIHAVAGRTFPAGERGNAAGSLLSSHCPNYTWACVLCRPSPESPPPPRRLAGHRQPSTTAEQPPVFTYLCLGACLLRQKPPRSPSSGCSSPALPRRTGGSLLPPAAVVCAPTCGPSEGPGVPSQLEALLPGHSRGRGYPSRLGHGSWVLGPTTPRSC
jgi:hypothetical protein